MKKNIVVPIAYWLIVGLFPILFGIVFGGNGSIMLWYILIGPIILSIIPYMIVSPQSSKEKAKFIILGLIIPLFLLYALYFWIIILALSNFRPSM